MSVFETKMFVWAYLLQNGRETTGEWNFYGGNWESLPTKEWKRDFHGELLTKVKSVGVDWEKTREPTSRTEFCFTDSFHPSQECEALLGTLVLLDGSVHIVGCKDEDNMGSYITKLMKLMKDKERVTSIFGEQVENK